MPEQHYIGLMSGTSVDSIDAVIVRFSENTCHIAESLSYPIPQALRNELHLLCQPGNNEIERMGAADTALGRLFAEAANTLLARSLLKAGAIRAIGSHGQTIRHQPSQANPFSLQIGDPNIIAYLTGITTVADFRRRDLAAGGQGAPLVPAFHREVFGSSTENRAIVNIGGIANISFLPTDGETLGFDTGPGNTLIDAWIQHNKGLDYDDKGQWAREGTIDFPLLAKLLNHPYLSKSGPKSTGREAFNLPWLNNVLPKDIHPADVQATLLEFTAQSIAYGLQQQKKRVDKVYLCGGGAYNQALVEQLQSKLSCPLTSTEELGIAPEWVEAAAFAWLAKKTLEKQPGNLPTVTNAQRPVILGGVYFTS